MRSRPAAGDVWAENISPLQNWNSSGAGFCPAVGEIVPILTGWQIRSSSNNSKKNLVEKTNLFLKVSLMVQVSLTNVEEYH